MGATMTLLEVIRDLSSLDESDTIYAVEPWTENSEVILAPEQAVGGLPESVKKLGMKYFLEVNLARDFIEGWKANLNFEPNLHEKCARIIKYAVTDA
jgi:hypothetical protein